MIENKNEVPVLGLIMLGATTARGETDCIGAFGSGIKHSICIFLRKGIEFCIFSGETKITFRTRKEIFGSKILEIVQYNMGEEWIDTGFCLEFGELDWVSSDMAMREVISNALDQNKDVCKLKLTEELKGESGFTRFYVECTPDIEAYVREIDKHFLHFCFMESKETIRVPAGEARGPRIYRRGVFIRELPLRNGIDEQHFKGAVYDYNFQDMPIDECRNLDDWRGASIIGNLLSGNKEAFQEICERKIRNNPSWESTQIHSSALLSRTHYKEWWEEKFGAKLHLAYDNFQITYAIDKGIPAVIFKEWHHKLVNAGVNEITHKPLNFEAFGLVEEEPSAFLCNTFEFLWSKLYDIKFTGAKKKPILKGFHDKEDDACGLHGEVSGDTIYVNEYFSTNKAIVLKFIVQYITESTRNDKELAHIICTLMEK